eukprot:6484939-Amphidinium_carterae.5
MATLGDQVHHGTGASDRFLHELDLTFKKSTGNKVTRTTLLQFLTLEAEDLQTNLKENSCGCAGKLTSHQSVL